MSDPLNEALLSTVVSVSIVIPAWNEETTLKPTLEALLQTDYDKKQCEVIVVAGGDDNTEEIACGMSRSMEIFSRYIVIPQSPLGKNAAIQEGIKRVQNEIIVILDADTMVSKGWLKRMVEPLEKGTFDLTIANLEPVTRNWISDFYMISKVFVFKPHKSILFGNLDWGIPPGAAGVALKSYIVKGKEAHFFNRDVHVGVDHLLFKKISEQQGKIGYIEDAVVTTHLPSSLKYFLKVELRWLTALVNIDGANYKELLCSIIIVGALIFALVPLSRIVFMFCALFTTLFVLKKAHMFVVGSRYYKTNLGHIFGFILLSYIYHLLRLISHMRYFLGMSKQAYLSQGQRY